MLSCSDDSKEQPVIPDNESGIYGSVIGEWLDESTGDGICVYQTCKYLSDGTSHYWVGIATKGESIYSEYDGTYSFVSGIMTESYISPVLGQDITDKNTVRYLDSYTLSLETLNGGFGTLCRVVDTYNLNVGDEMKFETPDENFVALDYESFDSSIAEVDCTSGRVMAKRRGMTFIKGSSLIGNAAIRVIVSDSENYIDDFSRWIGQPLKEANRIFGSIYIDIPKYPLSTRQYSVIDPLISIVEVQYAMQKIHQVAIALRERSVINEVVDWMDSKYELINDFPSLNQKIYKASTSDGSVMIYFNMSNGQIIYMPYKEEPMPGTGDYGDENFQGLENLLGMNARDAAASFSHEISNEEWETGSFEIIPADNEVFRQVTVLFENEDEPFEVFTIMAFLKKGVDIDAVKDWYEKNYVVTEDELNPYTNKDKSVFIRFKNAGTLTYVQYRKTKYKK